MTLPQDGAPLTTWMVDSLGVHTCHVNAPSLGADASYVGKLVRKGEWWGWETATDKADMTMRFQEAYHALDRLGCAESLRRQQAEREAEEKARQAAVEAAAAQMAAPRKAKP